LELKWSAFLLPPFDASSNVSKPFQELKREPTEADWETLMTYSRRIRSLSNSSISWHHSSIRVGPSVASATVTRTSRYSLFPNLFQLSLGYRDLWRWAIHVVLTPYITRLEIIDEDWSTEPLAPADINPILQHLVQLSPKIEYLSVQFEGDPENSAALSLYLAQPLSVPHIKLNSCRSRTTLQRLSALPNLETLEIAYTPDDETPPELQFVSLQHLSIRSEITDVIDLLRSARSCLQNFEFISDNDFFLADSTLEELMAVIQQNHRNTLTTLRIIVVETLFVLPRIFKRSPLLPHLDGLQRLQRLVLHAPIEIPFDDLAVSRLALDLPLLKELGICSGRRCRHAGVTLSGFFSLLQGCPGLETVSIDLNALSVPAAFPPVFSSPLTLELGWAPIDNPKEVSDLLRATLPYLVDLQWNPERLDTNDEEEFKRSDLAFHDSWLAVRNLLPSVRKITDDEWPTIQSRFDKYGSSLFPTKFYS
jgi:hypothetical protein